MLLLPMSIAVIWRARSCWRNCQMRLSAGRHAQGVPEYENTIYAFHPRIGEGALIGRGWREEQGANEEGGVENEERRGRGGRKEGRLGRRIDRGGGGDGRDGAQGGKDDGEGAGVARVNGEVAGEGERDVGARVRARVRVRARERARARARTRVRARLGRE